MTKTFVPFQKVSNGLGFKDTYQEGSFEPPFGEYHKINMTDRDPTIDQGEKFASPNRSGNRTKNLPPRETTKKFTMNIEGMQGTIFDFSPGKSNQFNLPHKEIYYYVGYYALFKRSGMASRCIYHIEDPNYINPMYLQMKK